MPRLAAILIAFLLAAVAAGCGEGGAADGATVSVYVAAPLCQKARAELKKDGRQVGGLEVRAVCLPQTAQGGHQNLALAGRNARRATEDSSSVAFVEASGSAAPFTRSIVDAADIAFVETGSGRAAMRDVLRALEERGSASPRSGVLDQVG